MSNPAVTDANVITFITADPRSVGFSAIRTANPGQDEPLIVAANNAEGPGSGTVAGDPMNSADFFDLIDGEEYNAMTGPQLTSLQTIMSPGSVKLGSAPTQAKLDNLLADYATSLAAVRAKYTTPAGAWEVYFGKGNLADGPTLDHARNSGSGNNF